MKLSAALFDLDDTLYREMDYVSSGFRAAARFLRSKYGFNEEIVFNKTMDILNSFGRGNVFNKLLEELGIFDEEILRYLIYIYRTHRPAIHVFGDVLPVLESLRDSGIKTGLITNGMAIVQQNKVAALGIARLFDVIIYPDAIGPEYWKPSPVPFKMALNVLGVPAVASVYVGDNPSRDFLVPNALGMKSVQIKRETCIVKETPEGQGYAAQTIIGSLSEYFGSEYFRVAT
ncbi:MAG: HAD hydrolase-like protein [Nitrospirae bacterium]|nr:HAD hydrolase-like protein [Nitrospirota bacterium]